MEHSVDRFVARGLYPERLDGDEPEPIEVERLRLSEINQFMMRPDVCEGRSMAALFLVREWLAGNFVAVDECLGEERPE